MSEKKLNLDFPSRISELESMMNKFSFKKIIYHIVFRGKGLEFDSYRDYSAGDDASRIDWMASSRANELLVKRYVEERDLKIVFLIDVSDGMVFGSSEKLKCEYVAEIAASLSHMIISSGDNVGFGLFDIDLKKMVLPLGGMRRFNIFSHELSNPENYGGRPPMLGNLLELLMDRLDGSIDIVFILSDFLNLGDNFSKNFEIFSSRFETIPIIVRDNLDEILPDINSGFVIMDPAGRGKPLIINPSLAKREYERIAREEKANLINTFESAGIESLEIKTSESFIVPLVEFLSARAKKKRVVMSRR